MDDVDVDADADFTFAPKELLPGEGHRKPGTRSGREDRAQVIVRGSEKAQAPAILLLTQTRPPTFFLQPLPYPLSSCLQAHH